ncbi:MAG: cell division protein FtsQ/DivIB [Bacteroidia bacterium]
MKRLKKIAFVALWVGLLLGLLFTMGFVDKEQDALLCKELKVDVSQDGDLGFLDNIDVTKLINERGPVVGQPKSAVDVTAIEKALNSHPDIANAEVFMSIDGEVKVQVKQRKPVVRVINADGESYYIDSEGKLMPLSEKYSAKVLVVNGAIAEPYSKRYMYSISDIGKDSLLDATSILDEIYAMTNYINADDFWKAQVQQIYVNSDRDMEIVPLAGDQKIIFGDTANMAEKFNKLMIFYQQGLNTTGWWNKYSTINLKFKNQIVCTKK